MQDKGRALARHDGAYLEAVARTRKPRCHAGAGKPPDVGRDQGVLTSSTSTWPDMRRQITLQYMPTARTSDRAMMKTQVLNV
jgi:hypothetical protein